MTALHPPGLRREPDEGADLRKITRETRVTAHNPSENSHGRNR